MAEENVMPVDEDEAEHANALPEDVKRTIHFAEVAANLTLEGFGVVEPGITNKRKALIALLLAKSAQNVRFACRGLTLGYYSGAYATLRSALEALEYAILFDSSEGEYEVAKWLQTQLSSNPAIEQERNEQSRRAKKALLDQENDAHIINQAMNEFWANANERIHVTLQGLTQQFGVALPDVLPSELAARFEENGNDLEEALAMYVLLKKLRRKGRTTITQGHAGDFSVEVNCRYDGDVLGVIAPFAFYIAHRLLDTVTLNDTFDIKDKDWRRRCNKWEREIRSS